MCSIFGSILLHDANQQDDNHTFNVIIERSHQRGRDGHGIHLLAQELGESLPTSWHWRETTRYDGWTPVHILDSIPKLHSASLIGNTRAEPTTEYVKEKRDSDQQPYRCGSWVVVHNGTIANDKELRTHEVDTSIDSAAIAETLHSTMLAGGNWDLTALGQHFQNVIAKLKGSYAIMATHDEHPGAIFIACNYRPIWYAQDYHSTHFASSREYFPKELAPQMIKPYSSWMFDRGGLHKVRLDTPREHNRKALVICSGGLDSVVAATKMVRDGYDVELLHFQYGSRAEGPEVAAISEVANALGVNVRYFPLPIYKPEDSPLLQADSKIAGGEAGAEFAHEWVPARNLAMLAIATALAEAGGFETLVLGNNLEEAGAYPDNEPEFIDKFNDLLPFAVGDGKKLRVLMPVGNLMKHEIVKLGHELGAPLDKTWSCYRAGHEHCGTCGPCFMRRTAFAINDLPEVITYANERA